MNYNEKGYRSLSQALTKEKDTIANLLRDHNSIYNLSISSFALGLVFYEESFVVIEENEEAAHKVFNALKTFSDFFNIQLSVTYLPSEEEGRTKPIIEILNSCEPRLITTKNALMFDGEILKLSFKINKEEEISRNEFIRKIIKAGYRQVEMVLEEGEFLIMGGF